jgi:Restriction endonuclease
VATNYDFQTLSPEDFERLCGDLLSAELGKRLEQFKGGRDGGIDLRHSSPKDDKTTIVQCKLYAPTAFTRLRGVISRDELQKIQKLNPTRYILATSIPLNPSEKQQLLEIIGQWCKSTEDILGRDDLNALIRKNKAIEQAHFKLWLTSTAVLEAVINAGVLNYTSSTLEDLQTEICRFVTHPGVAQAQQILNEHHHCLIVGVPGIGKTTLAKILIYQYIHLGFKPVIVSSDIKEAWDAIGAAQNGNDKIIVLYDDFLGQVSFETTKLQKNEDIRLIELMRLAKKRKNIRLILTTREYILAEAEHSHSILAANGQNIKKFTLNLGHYGISARAKILYNHLYFSNLPNSRLTAIVESGAHKKIIVHQNYNPRIVRAIVQHENFQELPDNEFVNQILSNLDDPTEVWKHPFECEINTDSQRILHLMWTIGVHAPMELIKRQFRALINLNDEIELEQRFNRSIKELDGNFIRTSRHFAGNSKDERVVFIFDFHNPSIRDYLSKRINREPRLLIDCLNVAMTYNQFKQIAESLKQEQNPELIEARKNALNKALRLINQTELKIVAFWKKSNIFKSRPDKAARLSDLLRSTHAFYGELFERVEAEAIRLLSDRESTLDLIRSGSVESVAILLGELDEAYFMPLDELADCMKMASNCILEIATDSQSLEGLVESIYGLRESQRLMNEFKSLAFEQSIQTALTNITQILEEQRNPVEDSSTCLRLIKTIETELDVDLKYASKKITDIFEKKPYPYDEDDPEVTYTTREDKSSSEFIDIDDLFHTLSLREEPTRP